ncbi:hypothetical protein FVEG_15789 [Fusarium verticillioides 7600]|uniref:Uncharacterized protein n=1 Tax=Gibberella moniliformis (strain M3125 / FGSC 7600) TaxID=334819 RepID=W7M0F7_GIBM7|nr:hypothetical protein FVEG_15789 [Fusarium verticillioides 7600]EWG45068.1 hypothetical protein FVEG_15789 [Fusarium verticillioides 7600]
MARLLKFNTAHLQAGSSMQLNVSDLRTALVKIKAQATHSVAMVVNHDLYDEQEQSYLTHRSASHCQTHVNEGLAVHNDTEDSTTRNHPYKAFGKPPGDSALGLAIQAANQASPPSSMEDLSSLWFARVLIAVSREAARCFGLGNCTYYTCLMQGVKRDSSGVRDTALPLSCLLLQRQQAKVNVFAVLDAAEDA